MNRTTGPQRLPIDAVAQAIRATPVWERAAGSLAESIMPAVAHIVLQMTDLYDEIVWDYLPEESADELRDKIRDMTARIQAGWGYR